MNLNFKEWFLAETNYTNVEVFQRQLPKVIDAVINKAFVDSGRNQGWMSYNREHWQENIESLKELLISKAKEIWELWVKAGQILNDYVLYGKLWTVLQGAFQKGPFTRRHINYAMSLGQHPSEVKPRTRGVQVGQVRGPYKKRTPTVQAEPATL